MAEVDTSIYPKANPNGFLENAAGYLGLANSAQQNRLLQTQNQQSHMDLVKNQVGYLVDGFSALASKPDLSADDFYQFGQRAVQEGILSPETYQAEAAAIAKLGNNPDALRQAAGNFSLRALDAGQRFSAQYGSLQMIDTGNALVPATVSPMTGVHPLGGSIQKTLSPSELATPAQIGFTPQNQPIMGTTGQLLEKAGVNALTAMPSQQPTGGNSLMPGQPAQGAAPAFNGPGVVVAPAPGEIEAQKVTGQQAGQALADARQREARFVQDVTPLEKAIPALERLGTTGTGPGTEQINEIASFLQSMGVPGVDAAKIRDFDEVRKYLSQYAQAGDPNTNDKLAAAFAANPSTGISNAAAVDVAKTALALRRFQNAQLRAFDATGQPESGYSKFASSFASEQDPRAYGLDMMTPDARKKLIGGLSGAEKSKFANSLRTAISLGLVKAPGQPQ